MIDLVDLQIQWPHNIVMHQLEILVADPVLHVPLSAGEEIVDDYYFVAGEHQTVHQVGTDETRATRHQYSLPVLIIQELHRREVLRHPVPNRRLQMLKLTLQLADPNLRLLDVPDVSVGRLVLDILNFLRCDIGELVFVAQTSFIPAEYGVVPAATKRSLLFRSHQSFVKPQNCYKGRKRYYESYTDLLFMH